MVQASLSIAVYHPVRKDAMKYGDMDKQPFSRISATSQAACNL
jgi:hypothetical protein